MITLSYGLKKGVTKEVDCANIAEITSVLQTVKQRDVIWLATANGMLSEILVTESIDLICDSCKNGFFNIFKNGRNKLFVQAYDSFESAYGFALCMKLGHPKQRDMERKD